jgi:hypothetical protein
MNVKNGYRNSTTSFGLKKNRKKAEYSSKKLREQDYINN